MSGAAIGGHSRRAFLLGGFAAVALTRSGVGIARKSGAASGGTSLLAVGLKGDGTTDDRAALVAALARGGKYDGGGRTYGIAGNAVLPARTWIQNATFRQLVPTTSRCRTLTSDGGDAITLIDVKVDRNGSGREGGLDSTGGIWLQGGGGHHLERIECTGNGIGNGIVLFGVSETKLIDAYVHDMAFDLPTARDDSLQGIWLNNTTNCTLTNPQVARLTGNAAGQDKTRFTRGIASGGSHGLVISGAHVVMVDQGIDMSGGKGNSNFLIENGLVSHCYTWGVKCANSAFQGMVRNMRAEDCGIAGFVASGPSLDLPIKTSFVDFVNCVAVRPGSNGQHLNPNVAGFMVLHLSVRGWPKAVRFINCQAIDDQPTKTMRYGFHIDSDGPMTQVVARDRPVMAAGSRAQFATSAAPIATGNNEIINCTTTGALVAAQN